MTTVILGIIVVVIGAIIRSGAPAAAQRGGEGAVRLAGYGAMAAGILIIVSNAITVIGVGQVGILHFLGTVDETPLNEGVHFVNPLASIEKMSVQEQSFPAGGGVEVIEAQTSEQLNVTLEIAILFKLDRENAPDLYRRLGSESTIKSSIVLNAVRDGVRSAIATKSINEIFSPERREIAGEMLREIQEKAGDRIEVVEVFVRDVQAPARVQEAIQARTEREQEVEQERFQTEIIQERAQQAVEEARGIAEAQIIISSGLTPAYLTYHYIEQLGTLPAGSVVYVPTEGGIPLMRQLGGGGTP
ncbi:MAG: prohibitin family protein [Gemmatimonadota bacterium]|nr:prohibitin family protein [Gemmatimonadota bacterium]MDH3421409.1 prohibitin family protein [Gemmatimonadota bacterium]